MGMKTILKYMFAAWLLVVSYSTHAILSMELTQGVLGATPIAVVPFENASGSRELPDTIISNDLQNSGRFKVAGRSQLADVPTNINHVSPGSFKKLGVDYAVFGRVESLGGDRYRVSFQLVDLLKSSAKESVVIQRAYTVGANGVRAASHHISDLVYEYITGVRGVFSTKLAYVVVSHGAPGSARYALEVSDQDGYNPHVLLNSSEPIMSPAWSKNGRSLAYVSFEKKHAAIYLQDVATGSRRLLTDFPGINGAPAWSPDGQKLAIVLSKSGSPNIYVLDIATRQVKQITNDFYINTEPSWSPNGSKLLFTSNRSGNPQIYQVSAHGGSPERISFNGDYNARAAFTPDGSHVAMMHRVNGLYRIGILDLDSGNMRVLGSTPGDSSSPSVAPNGSMILHDTIFRGRSMLAMVSADGRVQLVLPARNGSAQDPAWSPFLS